MSKKPRSVVAKLCLSACLLAGVAVSAGCTSTLGLEEYEVTSLERCDDDLVDLGGDAQNCGSCGAGLPVRFGLRERSVRVPRPGFVLQRRRDRRGRVRRPPNRRGALR